DILEALGVRIEIPPKRVEEIISDIGIGFLFAPVYHPAMKHVARARREIGFRSIFNLLGPLLNPAGATAQLLGVYARELCLPLAHVLADLGLSHAMVVHGEGLDEITTTGITTVAELKDGIVTSYTLDSRDLGFLPADETTLAGGSPEKNAAIIRSVFSGKPGPVYDIVALNAGAAIYLAGGSADLGAGVTEALIALQSGAAERKLDQLIRATGQAS
ncbi:MAG: anthranilate phosphoribosyltransferase, partial [Candidatus Subteraquimicrobiales bacterium]|nr:anthranilate phosphoribosyltransferase [Candidatus Subteraquimicrobiales bacterium]